MGMTTRSDNQHFETFFFFLQIVNSDLCHFIFKNSTTIPITTNITIKKTPKYLPNLDLAQGHNFEVPSTEWNLY